MDAHVRDNFLETAPAKVTTKGDIVAALGANSIARVPISSSNGGILVQNSACNAGVMFDGRFAIAASVPTVTAASNAVLALNTTSAGNKRSGLELRSGGTNQYIAGVDFGSNNDRNFFIFDSIDGAARMLITTCGQMLIGTSTCNTAASNAALIVATGNTTKEAFTIKNSSIAHGMTDETETDSIGNLIIHSGPNGGISLEGFSEGTVGVDLSGFGTSGDTNKSTTSDSYIRLIGYKKSGTAAVTPAANENVVTIQNGGTVPVTNFIFDADGDFHANAAVSASAYDRFDDAQLLRALQVEVTPQSVIANARDSFLKYNRRDLEQAKIATFNDGPGGDKSVFVNHTKLDWLLVGAVAQLNQQCADLREQNLTTAACLMRLAG